MLTGNHILFLKTHDRNTGKQCVNSVYYRECGENYIVVAANDDESQKPDWYLNIKAEPSVEIEIDGMERFATATTPVRRERMKIWPLVEELAHDIEKRLPRNVSAVVLTPLD
jgi:deazaflavin-dependent oxidoreductase (nitroreductase family)